MQYLITRNLINGGQCSNIGNFFVRFVDVLGERKIFLAEIDNFGLKW